MAVTPKRLAKVTFSAGGTVLAGTVPAGKAWIVRSIRVTPGANGTYAAYVGGTAENDKVGFTHINGNVGELLTNYAASTASAQGPSHPLALNALDTLYVGGSLAGCATVYGIEVDV